MRATLRRPPPCRPTPNPMLPACSAPCPTTASTSSVPRWPERTAGLPWRRCSALRGQRKRGSATGRAGPCRRGSWVRTCRSVPVGSRPAWRPRCAGCTRVGSSRCHTPEPADLKRHERVPLGSLRIVFSGRRASWSSLRQWAVAVSTQERSAGYAFMSSDLRRFGDMAPLPQPEFGPVGWPAPSVGVLRDPHRASVRCDQRDLVSDDAAFVDAPGLSVLTTRSV